MSAFTSGNETLKEMLDSHLDVIHQEINNNDLEIVKVKLRKMGGNHTLEVQDIINNMPKGGVVWFPPGEYILDRLDINKANIIFDGSGTIVLKNDIRVTANNFTCRNLCFKAIDQSVTRIPITAFRVDTHMVGRQLDHFTFANCEFHSFYYALRFQGTKEHNVSNITVTGCRVYGGTESGHFLNEYTHNTSYLSNSCFGGNISPTFYYSRGSGYIKLIGNYDHDNEEGSCLIEDCHHAKGIIIGNNFRKRLWVHQSDCLTIVGNTCEGMIRITIEEMNGENINVSDNVCSNVSITSEGKCQLGYIDNLKITDNILTGEGNWGVFVNGRHVRSCRVTGNLFVSDAEFNSGSIGIIRNPVLDLVVIQNDINGKVVISGSGGRIESYGNKNYSYLNYSIDDASNTYALEQLHLSGGNALNLTDIRLHKSKYKLVKKWGEYDFALRPLMDNTGRLVKLTYTCKQCTKDGLYDSVIQEIIVHNCAGNTSVSTGTPRKVLVNEASDFEISYSVNADASILRIHVHNHQKEELGIRVVVEEHDLT